MKIKCFKLNALSAEGLRLKEMNAIIGGRAWGVHAIMQTTVVHLLQTT